VAFIAGMFIVPSIARAATLYLLPSNGKFEPAKTFTVVAKVDTRGVAANAIEAVLSFDPKVLNVTALSTAGSIFDFNIRTPAYSNINGTISLGGVIVNPGYTGQSGTLLTITFKGILSGSSRVGFLSGSVLANDGKGSELLSGTSGGTYEIGRGAVLPSPAVSSDILPVVTSPTHPDSSSWYSNSAPVFNWTLPTGVNAVSYLLHVNPTANPGNVSDGLVNSASFSGVSDGTTYFHIKFRRGGVWGPITHVPVQIDTKPPKRFTITQLEDGERPRLVFATTDEMSGVDHYVVSINDGEGVVVPSALTSASFTVPVLEPGTYQITVDAVDRAGNSTRESVKVAIEAEAKILTEKMIIALSALLVGLGCLIGLAIAPLFFRRKSVGHLSRKDVLRVMDQYKKMLIRIHKIVQSITRSMEALEKEKPDLNSRLAQNRKVSRMLTEIQRLTKGR
jgi:hypothetical protein